MERYHIYKLGIAILFYAIYCRRPMLVNCDDAIGNVNDTSHKISAREYFVYYQGVQGRPGVDFPVFSRIPRTSFSCREVESGYYADLQTDCQVFHICNDGTKVSFLCPNGTIFQQADLICDWWFKVNCTNSPSLYEESAEQLRESIIRRKASRRVTSASLEVQGFQAKSKANQFAPPIMSRKVDVVDASGRQGRTRHVFAVDDASAAQRSEEEMQIPQESASFVRDYSRKMALPATVTKNPYPNHRETYSDIQDPRTYYTNKPASSSNVNALNNGRPFVVSTPKIGSYTTEKTTFKYSPTVPSVKKHNYITPLPSSTTTKKYMSTYGERIRLANAYAHPNPVPKSYSNVDALETFTNPPSVANGKSATQRQVKSKTKTSFTIGLNSAQGSVAVKTPSLVESAPFKEPRPNKNKSVIKLNLSSDGPAKTVPHNERKPKIRLDLGDNEITSNPRTNSGFYVTKSTFRPGEYATSDFNAGSATGVKNTYIPTTTRPVTTFQPPTTTFNYISNTFGFVKPTGVPKPKPFELPSTTTPRTQPTTDFYDHTNVPNYQISSASPFTNVPPTLPSTYNGKSYVGSTPISPNALGVSEKRPLPVNVGNMLQTLQEIANVRFANSNTETGNTNPKQEDTSRPGLVVPPSVGPQTLHTLAVYFANALDSLVEESNATTESTVQHDPQDNTLVNSLLSMDTVNKYKELFMIMAQQEMKEETPDEDPDEDLQREHSNNAVQSPRVRQLAKVFTQALSSYLDDPESFKKVLHQVRPTEPPLVNTLGAGAGTGESLNNEEDELLNFSDADIKPENPRLPTLAPPNPTWGYILAYNTTDYGTRSNHLDQNEENLQSADSQSFIPGFNELNSNRVDKSLQPPKIPNNHWTSSPDVTKLWRSTLYVNPLQINQNFDATEALVVTSTEETEEFDDDDFTQRPLEALQAAHEQEDSVHRPVDVTEYNTERYIDYELRSLPKFNLNSTSVHGLLIDFMNSSKYDENGRLQRILRKLNTTEDEFLTKMKEIEQNPLTKRLILLLVSECGNSTDARTHAVRDIINLAQQSEQQGHQGEEAPQRHLRQPSIDYSQSQSQSQSHSQPQPQPHQEPNARNVENSSLQRLVDPKLKDDDQDSRAIQLLNSLYSIASKYGK